MFNWIFTTYLDTFCHLSSRTYFPLNSPPPPPPGQSRRCSPGGSVCRGSVWHCCSHGTASASRSGVHVPWRCPHLALGPLWGKSAGQQPCPFPWVLPSAVFMLWEALAIAGTYVREKQDPFTSEKEVPSTGIEEVSPGFFSLLYFRFHSSLFPSQWGKNPVFFRLNIYYLYSSLWNICHFSCSNFPLFCLKWEQCHQLLKVNSEHTFHWWRFCACGAYEGLLCSGVMTWIPWTHFLHMWI